ncbi:MAG: hypothetical protein ACE5EY_03005 [Anaerolineae bacterium]
MGERGGEGERINILIPVPVPTGTLAGMTDNMVLVSAPTTDIGLATSATGALTVVESFDLFLPVVLKP